MTEPSDKQMRAELKEMVAKIENRDMLLFVLWSVRRISQHLPMPEDRELKALRDAFLRVTKAIRERRKAKAVDLELVTKWIATDTDKFAVARALAQATKFYREKAKLSRLQLSKKSGFPLRSVIAIERGRITDMAVVRLQQLADGLGVTVFELMNRVFELTNDREKPHG
jgi:Helix-turn-helix